ncbi:MAG: glycosyltransferase family 4 protein [Gallionella sp.]
MKIALYVHCFFPTHYHGTETYTLALAKNLRAMGHEPVVVSSIPVGEKRAGSLITHYEYQGIPVYCIDKNYIPHTTLGETYHQPKMRQIHMDLLEELRPDIVHVTHIANHSAALLDATQDLAIPAVATFTDFFGFCYNSKLEAADGSLCSGPNSQRTNCFACYVKAGVRQANSTLGEKTLNRIAPLIQWGCTLYDWVHKMPVLKHSQLSARLRDIKARPKILAKHYGLYRAVFAPTLFLQTAYERNGLTAAPIHKINFGVDLDRQPKQTGPASQPIRFGFIGQIAPHKGTALLVEAFCRLPIANCELHIYGAEDQFPAYSLAMKERCTSFPVFFRGIFPAERMRQVLDEMDFLVIPSTWYENSPLVLLDALASHTPVIVSDVEGLTEFLEQGKNGYAFTRGSIEDLERVMRQILANPESSRQLSNTTNYPKTTMSMTEEVVAIYNSFVVHGQV